LKIVHDIFSWFLKRRIDRIEAFRNNPIETQQDVLHDLLLTARDTDWGRKHQFASIRNHADFIKQVPVSSYEDLYPQIERVLKGEHNVLWPTEIKWFSKSSGTTNARSKFLPVSNEALESCHFMGGRDLMTLFINNRPDNRIFEGKGLSIGGSLHDNPFNPNTRAGDVSAIMTKNLPAWAEYLRTPPPEVALLDRWEDKLNKMIELCPQENVTSMLGVPTWVMVMLDRIMEERKVSNMLEIWPNFEVFFHGAVNFQPYRDMFMTKYFPSSSVSYLESYNASEGYFAIQDDLGRVGEMLLMLDYGVYFEFIPLEDAEKEFPRSLTLDEVELDKQYALVISTNSGLWRYKIGDTIKFTSKYPFRIKISGRTKHFINAYGEEVMIENTDDAITRACDATNAVMSEYTAGPIYMSETQNGGHEWVIECSKMPNDTERFIDVLDARLREINSDYDAKRYQDMALGRPTIHFVPVGTFYQWLADRGKLGGQHKVPRLSNNRDYLDEVLKRI
jgi:hypothetical protein